MVSGERGEPKIGFSGVNWDRPMSSSGPLLDDDDRGIF